MVANVFADDDVEHEMRMRLIQQPKEFLYNRLWSTDKVMGYYILIVSVLVEIILKNKNGFQVSTVLY